MGKRSSTKISNSKENLRKDTNPILLMFFNIIRTLLNTVGEIFSRNPILFLFLIEAVAAEMMALSPDGPDTTVVCYRDIPNYPNDLGFRYHDYSGTDGYSSAMFHISRLLNCGIEGSPPNSAVINCLQKGVGLVAQEELPDRSIHTYSLVEPVETSECEKLINSLLRV